ncbi:unnamed protein product, partial [Urochloa humidicola]
ESRLLFLRLLLHLLQLSGPLIILCSEVASTAVKKCCASFFGRPEASGTHVENLTVRFFFLPPPSLPPPLPSPFPPPPVSPGSLAATPASDPAGRQPSSHSRCLSVACCQHLLAGSSSLSHLPLSKPMAKREAPDPASRRRGPTLAARIRRRAESKPRAAAAVQPGGPDSASRHPRACRRGVVRPHASARDERIPTVGCPPARRRDGPIRRC